MLRLKITIRPKFCYTIEKCIMLNPIFLFVFFVVLLDVKCNPTSVNLVKNNDIETLKQFVLKLNDENVETRKTVQNLQTLISVQQDKLDEAIIKLDNVKHEQCVSRNDSGSVGHGRRQLKTTATTSAFYAYMTKDETSPGPHHTLIFDYAVTNLGSNYNIYTGIFTAPKSGYYAFSYSITPGTSAYMPVELIKNAAVVGSSYNRAYSSYTTPASSTTVVQLNAGDVCYLRTSTSSTPSGNIHSSSTSRSSFAGFLLA